MIRTIDIAWAAGIIEGEAWIGQCNGKYKTPRLVLKMTDEDVVKKFADITGAKFRYLGYKKGAPSHWKPQWNADLSGEKTFQWLMTIYPLLGKRRGARAKKIILDYINRPVFNHQQNKTHCPKGHAYTEKNTRYSHKGKGWRSCRECHRDGMRKGEISI